jgi:hypothetical protein
MCPLPRHPITFSNEVVNVDVEIRKGGSQLSNKSLDYLRAMPIASGTVQDVVSGKYLVNVSQIALVEDLLIGAKDQGLDLF